MSDARVVVDKRTALCRELTRPEHYASWILNRRYNHNTFAYQPVRISIGQIDFPKDYVDFLRDALQYKAPERE